MISYISVPLVFTGYPVPCSVGRLKGTGGLWRADRLKHPGRQCLRGAQVLVGYAEDATDLHWRGGTPFCRKHDPVRLQVAYPEGRPREESRVGTILRDMPASVLEAELARRRSLVG